MGLRVAATVGGAAALGSLLYHHHNRHKASDMASFKMKLPRPLMEAFCGAVGEIASVAVLYPLDTIKVRCQATGHSAMFVMKDLLKHGWGLHVLRQLYAGVVPASICSVAIGSLYYFSFCAAKRVSINTVSGWEKQAAVATGATAAGTAVGSDTAVIHGPVKDMHHDSVLASICSAEAMSPTNGSAAAMPGTEESLQPQGRLMANMMAACGAAMVGAMVEAPVELFKHQTQAGVIHGNMLGNMWSALMKSGPAGLYFSFVPFCLKSLPFDIGELLTYSQLRDAQGDFAKRETPLGNWVRSVPDHAWDMAIGSAAGVAAVLVSMPSDVIKTVIETKGHGAGQGVLGSLKAFGSTGKDLVAKGGLGSLYVGLLPRLAGEVPSTMLYWLAVEACRRLLEPYTA